MVDIHDKKVYAREHPNANANGQIRDYRLRASNAIGRPLGKEEEIHHFGDFIVICQNRSYHKLLHIREKAKTESGDVHNRKCHYCNLWDSPLDMGPPAKLGPHERGESGYYHRECAAKYQRDRKFRAREKRMRW